MVFLLRGVLPMHLGSGQPEATLPTGVFIERPMQFDGIEIRPENFGEI
jgi:hypothetical protein